MINSTTLTPNFKTCKNGASCIHPDGPALPRSEFYARKGMKDGLYTICKQCFRADMKTRHAKPRGDASYPSEQRAIDKLRSVGIYASPGKSGEWAHIDVLAWGCVRVEVKTAKMKNGVFVFPLGYKSVERFQAHDVVLLVCLYKHADPTFHVFLSTDPVFYNETGLKNGVAYMPLRSQAKKRKFETMSNELMLVHQNKWDIIEVTRLNKRDEMVANSGKLDTRLQATVKAKLAA